MADVFSPARRSAVMAKVRSAGNHSTELRLVAGLRAAGITGWRRGVSLPGRPDFVFRRRRVALFVDGCFWHGCPVHGTIPRGNAAYWAAKIDRNRMRDRRVDRALKKKGWRVVRIWEHALGRAAWPRTRQRLEKILRPAPRRG